MYSYQERPPFWSMSFEVPLKKIKKCFIAWEVYTCIVIWRRRGFGEENILTLQRRIDRRDLSVKVQTVF